MQSHCIGNKYGELIAGDPVASCPILKLPPEIIAEIFLHCLEGEVAPHDMSPTPAFAIIRVCRHWRTIGLSLSRLWCSLKIRNPSRDLLSLCIGRSAEHPLSLHLTVSDGDTLLDIQQFLPRIRGLYLECTWKQWNRMAGSQGQQLPLLRALALSAWDEPRAPNQYPLPITIFHDAPELRELYLHSVSPVQVRLPWSQLTSFHGTNLYLSFHVLCLMVSLINCSLRETKIYLPTSITSGGPPLNASLKSLQIDDDRLLRFWRLPALKTLHLCAESHRDTSNLSDFLSLSECSIEHVHFSGYNNEQEVISSLELLPDLVELKLTPPSIFTSNLFFQWLIDFPAFLPNLARFEIEADGYNWTDQTLVDMLWCRWHLDHASFSILQADDVEEQGHVQLVAFKASCPLYMAEVDALRVQSLRANGMTIDIELVGGWP
ncbi:hypothetical protein C8R44DRAFT_762145 [Mycena epipterygia]|nr:hypothetical protein C8R44DRAFT_762145 [Mycena epipterygia]